ncbi:hypothetical protein L9F63_021619 [Diploptera punctata]|uniref:Uncharacterized protein n=1 Tax=Diploptera punctata TaxID=6984 RepID=A0AAD7ZPY8_DIPPU|nr:hypothetical protein L9F63_021619 [Diploptera punctata]
MFPMWCQPTEEAIRPPAVSLSESSNMCDVNTGSELHDAVRRQDVDAVQRLLAQGADPDEPDWSGCGNAPLLNAAALGSVQIVRALCAGGCNVNIRTARGETALHLAVTSRKTSDNTQELVAALLDVGCDANIQDNLQGWTALHALVRQLVDPTSSSCPHVLETLKQLACRCDVNLQDHRKRTPLHRLAGSGCTSLDAFKVLLECGADPSIQNDRGETALHEALERDAQGSSDAVTLLVKAGTDLSRCTSYRETPLHLAARKNRPGIVAMLLDKRAPPNAQDLRGNTALHLAAGRGYREVVRLLLAAPHVQLNAPNKDGLTPLHIAVESGFINVVEMLLQADACDLTARTKLSQTPLDLAQQEYRRRSQPEMTRVLTQEIERRRSHGNAKQC